jgi:hypothetical protein
MNGLSEGLTSPRAAVSLALRVAALFLGFNLLYLAVNPIEEGRLPTVYNTLLPGRLRATWTNGKGLYVSETRVSRILADLTAARPKQPDEYRVFVLGSSESWGAYVKPEEVFPIVLDDMGLTAPDGRHVRVYNVAYPLPDSLKDLLFTAYFLKHNFQPDLILFALNPYTFNPPSGDLHPLLLANPDLAYEVVRTYGLSGIPHLDDLAAGAPAWERHNFFSERGDLAYWLTNQGFGLAWALTGIDYDLPTLGRQSKYGGTLEWTNIRPGTLDALKQMTAERQVGLMLFSSPSNYTAPPYNQWIRAEAERLQLPFLDCRELLPTSEFTNSGLHLTPQGHQILAEQLAEWLRARWNEPDMPLVSACPDHQEGQEQQTMPLG